MQPHIRKRDQKMLAIISKVAEAADHIGLRAKLAAAIVIKNEIISFIINIIINTIIFIIRP